MIYNNEKGLSFGFRRENKVCLDELGREAWWAYIEAYVKLDFFKKNVYISNRSSVLFSKKPNDLSANEKQANKLQP